MRKRRSDFALRLYDALAIYCAPNSTLREMAAKAGIGPATVLRLKQGKACDVETLRRLCALTGADPSAILGLEATRESFANVALIGVAAKLNNLAADIRRLTFEPKDQP